MSKQIEHEILEVEQRIARRRMSVDLTARAAWHRSVSKVFSPVGLLSAAALGFVTVAAVLRRRPKIVERRRGGRSGGKWAGVLGLLASGGLALLKAQYGSPVNMAHSVLGQVKDYKARRNRDAHGGAVAR